VAGHSEGVGFLQLGKEIINNHGAAAVGRQATSWVTVHMKLSEKTRTDSADKTTNPEVTSGIQQEGMSGAQELPQRDD
jgi:hypothetical protein